MNDGTNRRSSSAAPAQSRFTVVPRPHAVEEVGHHPRARVGGGARLRVGRGAVTEGDDDAAFAQCSDRGQLRIGLRRERDDAHEPLVAIAAREQPLEVHRPEQVDRVRAGRTTEERSLEVHADRRGRAVAHRRQPVEHAGVLVQWRADDRRDARRAATGDESVDRGDDLVDARGCEVDGAGTVDLHVDEPRREDRIRMIDDLGVADSRRRARSDCDDPVVLDHDPRR